jgi:SnoaL-like protein
MTPEQLLAREAICHTQSTYNTAGDRGRLDELIATFTDDGVLDFFRGVFTGKQAIRDVLSGAVDRNAAAGSPAPEDRGFLRHNMTTRHIEFRDDTTADAWTYFLVMSPVGLDHCGLYVDRFVAQEGRWLIARRRVKIDWRAENSTLGPA